ncbi:MAG: EutN/CcmL family microcompartment protein [Blastocatellia bacterium]|nr:EutN/CcmL family microcompartment protein [Blastocatellia bacterium]
MLLARVIGNVVATQKEVGLVGGRILMVQPVTLDGLAQGSAFMALDSVDAGTGDLVVVVQEGWSASTASTGVEGRAIDAAVIGVVDEIESDK